MKANLPCFRAALTSVLSDGKNLSRKLTTQPTLRACRPFSSTGAHDFQVKVSERVLRRLTLEVCSLIEEGTSPTGSAPAPAEVPPVWTFELDLPGGQEPLSVHGWDLAVLASNTSLVRWTFRSTRCKFKRRQYNATNPIIKGTTKMAWAQSTGEHWWLIQSISMILEYLTQCCQRSRNSRAYMHAAAKSGSTSFAEICRFANNQL
mmetsp:Transcript_2179/g.6524  ORF Transcript_2179/g.6524 Transcript_2179/m.6524 type:complete len:205 (-) Transcript_2179:238-852(-)